MTPCLLRITTRSHRSHDMAHASRELSERGYQRKCSLRSEIRSEIDHSKQICSLAMFALRSLQSWWYSGVGCRSYRVEYYKTLIGPKWPESGKVRLQTILNHNQSHIKAVVTSTIRLRFECNSTALRVFDHLRCDRRSTCVWEVSVTAAIGVSERSLTCYVTATFDKH